MGQARTACDAWKKEAALANKKAELANKDKEAAIVKCNSLQKEVSCGVTSQGQTLIFCYQIEQLRVEAIRRVDQLHGLPPQYLKTIEWNLRKDIQEVEKVR